jgi:hypothetical protein
MGKRLICGFCVSRISVRKKIAWFKAEPYHPKCLVRFKNEFWWKRRSHMWDDLKNIVLQNRKE